MNTPSTPPETVEPDTFEDRLSPWQAKGAAIWLGLVTLAYLGTIVVERGERIRRIVDSFRN
ncbi:hypothetical protein GC170_12195 [bacterium]|nr:hypothetical protein [bacterium]